MCRWIRRGGLGLHRERRADAMAHFTAFPCTRMVAFPGASGHVRGPAAARCETAVSPASPRRGSRQAAPRVRDAPRHRRPRRGRAPHGHPPTMGHGDPGDASGERGGWLRAGIISSHGSPSNPALDGRPPSWGHARWRVGERRGRHGDPTVDGLPPSCRTGTSPFGVTLGRRVAHTAPACVVGRSRRAKADRRHRTARPQPACTSHRTRAT